MEDVKVRLVEYESGAYEILLGEDVVGAAIMREDEYDEIDDEEDEDYGKDNFYLLERFDIDGKFQGRGYGTQVLGLLKKVYGHYYIVPDSARAARLYDREGYPIPSKEHWEWGHAFDRGFGVYEIY